MNRKPNLKGQIAKTFMHPFVLLFILLGLVVVLAVFKTTREQRSGAVAATKVSFSPASSQSTPIQKNPNDTIPLDIMVDPGTNAVSFVTVFLQYDSGKLQYVDNSFQVNATSFPTVIEGPVANPGMFAVKVSIGSDPTKAIVAPAKLGTISFKAIDGTASAPTSITYTAQTSALSIGPNDTATENVVSTTEPAFIAISGNSNNPTATQAPTPTDIPPLPTDVPQPTEVPTTAPTDVPVPTDNPLTPTGVGGAPTATPQQPNPTNISNTSIPTPKPTPPPSKFKQKILRTLEKRLAQYEKRLAKLKNKKNVSASQVKHLEEVVKKAIQRIKDTLNSVNNSHRDKLVKKYVRGELKSLLTEYKDLAKKLRKFKKGMHGVAQKKKKSGHTVAVAETLLTSMDAHLSNAEMISTNTEAGVDRITTDQQLRLAFEAAKQNAKMVKSEFTKSKGDMTTAAQDIKKK